MKNIIKIIVSLMLSIVLYSVAFANIDSTRASGISKFDVNYLPSGNKCGYSIGYVLGYHEGYLRKYVSLVPVKVDLDSVIDQVNISTFGCSYNTWKSKLDSDNKICQDSYLKTPFIGSENLGVYGSGVFLTFYITGDSLDYDNNKISCNGKCNISLGHISNIVSNKNNINNKFPLDLSGGKINIFDTGFVIYSGDNSIKFNWSNVNEYPGYTPVRKNVKEIIFGKKYKITYQYLNYRLGGKVTYDLKKLYNYTKFRSLWHGLSKVGDTLVIKPIGGKNYVGYHSVEFSGLQVITQGDGSIHNVSEYNDNLCEDQHTVGSWWWVSTNRYKGVTSFAKSLNMSPKDHQDHLCASTWLKIKSYYFNGSRTDNLNINKINIGINTSGNIERNEIVDQCNTDTLNWERPKDISADVSNLKLQINNTFTYKNIVKKEFIGYSTDNNKICIDNINIKSVPVDFVGAANSVHPVYRKMTAIQMIIRPKDSTKNIGESNKYILPNPIEKQDVPEKLNNICFNIDWDKNGGVNAFKKKGKYWFLLKFWSDDEIRGNTSLMTIKIIPNNNYKLTNILHTSNIKADGKSPLVFAGKITDSFGNNIDLSKYGLINGFSVGNNIIDRDETNSSIQEGLFNLVHQFLSTGLFKLSYVAYNKKVVHPISSVVLNIKKRLLNGGLGAVVNVSKSVSSSPTISGIFNVDLLTGSNNGNSLPFNTDVRFKLKLKNTGNSNINNISIKFLPKFTVNGNDYTGVKFVPATGSIMLKKMLNGTYSLVNLSAGNVKNIYFTGRVEYSGDSDSFNSKIKLGGKVLLSYNLNGLDGSKGVKAYYPVNSNLNINYWGVYVEGLASNAVKGLYEILRKSKNNYTATNTVSDLKIKTYNKIVQNSNKLIRGIKQNKEISLTDIGGIYSNNGQDITLNGGNITKKSLIYVKGADVIIKGNIKKKGGILTIVAVGDKNGDGGHVYIANNVTNIDAIIVSQNGIYPLLAKNGENLKIGSMLDVVKGNKNDELHNQLLIYGMVISRSNTVGGSIKINGKYVKPGGKYLPGDTANFYRAAVYDLNYLRRYNINFNPGNASCKVSDLSYGNTCSKLDSNKYGTYPVIIKYDPGIQMDKPYGF